MAEQVLHDLVLVEISGGMFAFPAATVREVLPLAEPTPMPEWPDNVFGLIDVRGELVPLLDVASALGRPPAVINPRQLILMLQLAERSWGVLVDRVEGVVSAPIREAEGMDAAAVKPGLAVGLILWVQGPVVLIAPEGLVETLRLPTFMNPRAKTGGVRT